MSKVVTYKKKQDDGYYNGNDSFIDDNILEDDYGKDQLHVETKFNDYFKFDCTSLSKFQNSQIYQNRLSEIEAIQNRDALEPNDSDCLDDNENLGENDQNDLFDEDDLSVHSISVIDNILGQLDNSHLGKRSADTSMIRTQKSKSKDSKVKSKAIDKNIFF